MIKRQRPSATHTWPLGATRETVGSPRVGTIVGWSYPGNAARGHARGRLFRSCRATSINDILRVRLPISRWVPAGRRARAPHHLTQARQLGFRLRCARSSSHRRRRSRHDRGVYRRAYAVPGERRGGARDRHDAIRRGASALAIADEPSCRDRSRHRHNSGGVCAHLEERGTASCVEVWRMSRRAIAAALFGACHQVGLERARCYRHSCRPVTYFSWPPGSFSTIHFSCPLTSLISFPNWI
ncbi:MAG: hypothetical protein JWN48_4597 [Myxococcaceae bacterium]|nr:hypothetical protein [Myxococcaceae bacterium]